MLDNPKKIPLIMPKILRDFMSPGFTMLTKYINIKLCTACTALEEGLYFFPTNTSFTILGWIGICFCCKTMLLQSIMLYNKTKKYKHFF